MVGETLDVLQGILLGKRKVFILRTKADDKFKENYENT